MEEWVLIPSGKADWMSCLLMVNFLLFVLCKWRYEQQFFSFLRIIDTKLYFSSYGEKPIHQQGFTLLSALFCLINLSLFICFYLSEKKILLLDAKVFSWVFFGISGVVILRQAMLILLGYFFNIQHFINQYQFRTITYLFRLNILIFLGLIFYFYTFNLSALFLNSFALVALGLYGLYHLMVIKQLFSAINQGGLYFILYLCTLKLSPWILLINGLKLSL